VHRAAGRLAPFIPFVGIGGFTLLLASSLSRRELVARAMLPLSVAGGLVAAALLAFQAFVIHKWCKLCVGVDSAAVVAAVAAFASMRPGAGELPSERRGWLWPGAALFTLALPFVYAFAVPAPPVPKQIAALWVPGKINVVEFADFQCPFCRQLHPEMLEVLGEYGDRVHFVRLNMPLTSHSQARDAARAYCCADEQGKAATMADALFTAKSLAPADCAKLAESLGLSMPAYAACVASPKTDARIDAEIATVRAAGLDGLPTVWIDDQKLLGLRPIDDVRAAFARAASAGSAKGGQPWGVIAGFAVVLGVLGVIVVRRRRDGAGA
jgi:predicted DsbA family dithiol-disulfide isomerase